MSVEGLMTVREALARPLRKPAIRKLRVLTHLSRGLRPPISRMSEQWFVLLPVDWTAGINGSATPCASFDAALEELRRIGR